MAPSSPSDARPVTGFPKPRDEDLDFFGITHPGKVRQENQDHFLYATLHKTMVMTTRPAVSVSYRIRYETPEGSC